MKDSSKLGKKCGFEEVVQVVFQATNGQPPTYLVSSVLQIFLKHLNCNCNQNNSKNFPQSRNDRW